MNYLSTRGDTTPRRFCDILLEGLAPDGGLYLPTHYPQVDADMLARWRGLAYHELAFEILSLFIDDIPAADLRALTRKTYTAAIFGSETIVPLRALEPGVYIEALSNGPTWHPGCSMSRRAARVRTRTGCRATASPCP